MFEYTVCHTKVTFGFLKINRVYFMGHSRRTYFAFLCFLLKVIHRNISPDITAKINKDIVDPLHAVKMRCQIIVMFYLSRKLLAIEPDIFCKFIGKFYPVE